MTNEHFEYKPYGFTNYGHAYVFIAFVFDEPYPAPQNEPFHTLLISESIEKQKRYFTNRRK